MIRNYINSDFNDVNNITINSWKGELMLSDKLESLIYKLLPKYSFLNDELSFVDYSNKVDAFMFAGFKNDNNDSIAWFNNNINMLNEEEKKIAKDYFNYLDYNHEKVINHMNDNDIYLSLIASKKRNSGKLLLNHLFEIANKNNCNIFLWTDETCNYKYYELLGFNIIEEYYVELQNKKIKTFIYKR